MKTIYINGKFTAQPLTGVQRVARSMVQALDNEIAYGDGAIRWVLLCPHGASVPALRHIEVRTTGWRGMRLHAWEQLALPMRTLGQALLNLSGSAPLLKRRQICTFHDAAVFDVPQFYTSTFVHWYRFHFSWLSRIATSLITVSEFSRRRLVRHLRVPESRIAVVHNGADHLDDIVCDESILDALGIVAQQYFLVVGGGSANKNLAVVVEALSSSVLLKGHVIVAVGTVSDAVFASRAGADAIPPPRLIVAGAVSDAQLKALYRHGVCLVFVSSYEGFGLPPLEAMSCGCPVVASNSAAVPEICADAALYADPLSMMDVRRAMETVVSDPATRSRLIEAGHLRVRSFTWQKAARELLASVRRETSFA